MDKQNITRIGFASYSETTMDFSLFRHPKHERQDDHHVDAPNIRRFVRYIGVYEHQSFASNNYPNALA